MQVLGCEYFDLYSHAMFADRVSQTFITHSLAADKQWQLARDQLKLRRDTDTDSARLQYRYVWAVGWKVTKPRRQLCALVCEIANVELNIDRIHGDPGTKIDHCVLG